MLNLSKIRSRYVASLRKYLLKQKFIKKLSKSIIVIYQNSEECLMRGMKITIYSSVGVFANYY